MAAKHLIRSRRTEVLAGLAFFGLGALLLRDAYDQRGVQTPVFLRPFTFW
jgi:hypothetical protein